MESFHGRNPAGFRNVLLLCIVSIAAVLLVSPVVAGTGVTISAEGSQAYYLGEKVVLRGQNTDSGSIYLFLTGPNLPETGVKLSSPKTDAINGKSDTFTAVKTNADKTWEYAWYTTGLLLDAGSYTVYAASEPKTGDMLVDGRYDTTSIIIKKPFITAGISSSPVTKGMPFTVTGKAEGLPPEVQVWIFGDNYAYNATTPVNPDASFAFNSNAALSGELPAGQNYLIIQHPMADNRFDFVISGEYVLRQKLNTSVTLFKITGPGSLQGGDAADALIMAISGEELHDNTLTNDTYTIIPFEVTDVREIPMTSTGENPLPEKNAHIPLEYALPIGAGALVVIGIVLWKRN